MHILYWNWKIWSVILWWIIFFFLFAEPIRRSSSTSRNLLNPPQSLDFYGRRPPSVTSDMSQEKSFTATTASVNLNVLPLISKTKMVHASKKAFLQVLINCTIRFLNFFGINVDIPMYIGRYKLPDVVFYKIKINTNILHLVL